MLRGKIQEESQTAIQYAVSCSVYVAVIDTWHDERLYRVSERFPMFFTF